MRPRRPPSARRCCDPAHRRLVTVKSDAPGEIASATVSIDFPWRRNLVFVWFGVFAGMLGANFVFPFIPFFIDELGVDGESRIAFWTGVAGSATGLSLTLTAPLWGSLADRYGRRVMLLRALIGAGSVIALMGLAQDVYQLVGLRFAMGAFAGTMGAAAALVAATTPRDRVGFALGTLQTGQFTGNMIGPVVGGVVAAAFGLRQSFFICASLYAVAVVLTFLFVREPRGELAVEPSGRASHAPSGGLIENLRVVVAERQILVMLAMLFVLWLSTTYVRPVLPISIDNYAGGATGRVSLWLPWGAARLSREAGTGIVFGVIGASSTVAALSVSSVGRRVGYRNTVTGAAIITGVLYLPLAFAASFTTFVLFFGAVGLFQGAMVPGTNALIAAAVPDGKHGSAFGLAASMQSMALLTGPMAGGFTGSLIGIDWVYVVIGLLLVVAGAWGRVLIREPEGM
ncbi:MAG: multidrug efflux MFS transporter [Dehalococcoidia bacterium]